MQLIQESNEKKERSISVKTKTDDVLSNKSRIKYLISEIKQQNKVHPLIKNEMRPPG